MHFFQIIFIQKVLYRGICSSTVIFLQIFIQKVLYRDIYIYVESFRVFFYKFSSKKYCRESAVSQCFCASKIFIQNVLYRGILNCYRWACSLSAAAAAGGGGGGAAAASWALAGCSPLGPGFQICCCKSSPRVVRNSGLALHLWPSKAPRGTGGRMGGKTLIGRRLHTQPEEEEEEEEERKKKKRKQDIEVRQRERSSIIISSSR